MRRILEIREKVKRLYGIWKQKNVEQDGKKIHYMLHIFIVYVTILNVRLSSKEDK